MTEPTAKRTATGPNNRKRHVPQTCRVSIQASRESREIVLFREDGRVVLQIEEPDNGAEARMNIDQLVLVIVHLQRMYAEMLEEVV